MGRSVFCDVVWSDRRCLDGCCGSRVLEVTSPKTGHVLVVDAMEMPSRLYEALVVGQRLPYVNRCPLLGEEPEARASFRGRVRFSIAELHELKKCGTVMHPLAT